MKYNMKKYCGALELESVLHRLADAAVTDDAKERALGLTPEFELGAVEKMLRQTDDAYRMTARFSSPGFSGAENVSGALERAKVGAALSISELLKIFSLLSVIRKLKKWREDCGMPEKTTLEELFSALNPNKYLEDAINSAIKSEEELYDNASPALGSIRRKIASRSAHIRDTLEKIVRSGSAKYLQEAIITQRDGRFVVPVKAEYKNEIKGIVHDTSASGSTLFTEPMSVVEINNEIRVLRVEEQEEIARILAELSAMCSDFADSIKYSFSALVELDLIFAKARLAYAMGAVVPKLNSMGYIKLKRARHPSIPARTVVPITVELGGEYDSLVITGPNTGGKTVTLKTIGLLTLMAMCGMMIPADDGSEISVFDKVFADIGDEQSIEQSLSTFSSHMVNIISILDCCDENSLVLFDELCAGTDPIEGAALAKAILMRLHSRRVKAVATTHYAELKAYALDTERVENASCEFDVETLKPTYRLIIGVPGRSNAFAISQRLGLDPSIIGDAQSEISDDDMRFERVVAGLEQARRLAEQEHNKTVELRAELDAAKRRSENREHELKIKQDKLMEQTRRQAADIIENARYRSGKLLNELEEMKKQLNAENSAKMLDKARSEYKNTLRSLEESADPVSERRVSGEKLSGAPRENDIVVVSSIGRDATVLSVDAEKKKAYVASGAMKLWVSFDDLLVKKSGDSTEQKKTRKITGIMSRAQRTVSGELDLRGMAADEAILELDRYIDNAVLSGLETIRIIHGKGTGTLRKAVQQHLRNHKCISGFRLGTFGEGENGVTVAQLKG